ncbi:helix-turn-helix domain-containing protein [Pseudomonas helleri]|uniref:helix-turn-helix domain-containing protein n=1 Tax=Pseudomonas helleri TaxID=1608996 RepID=UPI003FD0F61E
MLHTIQEAIALTGKSRRTLYNHCDQGRLSYSVGHDERRYFETSELIRVYGGLVAIAQATAQEIAQPCTPDHSVGTLTEATALRLATAIEKLIEVEEKRLLLLEHESESQEPLMPEPKEKRAMNQKAESFSDLLKCLG